ncbi:MAG: hydroxylase [Acidobacteriota bacterium]
MTVQYLEIVTPAVEETCAALGEAHGVEFSEKIAGFGFARTARLEGGGLIGVRAPLRSTEEPVVRPYLLVDDMPAALAAAEKAGAEVAIPSMEIPGYGSFAIYILGGIEHGLWQNPDTAASESPKTSGE